MLQRGRKSTTALAIADTRAAVVRRVAPPASLTDQERALWLETVNGRPPEWFGREQIPLLEGFVRHAAAARIISGELNLFQPDWLKEDDGLRRYERLLSMREREVRAMSSLATRLRLTNQAVTDDETFGRKGRRGATAKPWQTLEG